MSPEALDAAWLSVRVAAWSTVLVLVPGVAIAWLLARVSFPGRTIVSAVVHLPLVLPPVVVGWVLLMLLGRRGPVGGWLHATFGIDLAFTWRAAAIASAVMGFPLLVRAARLAFEQVDPGLESAGRTLGASPWRVFRTVTLPLAVPGIAAGACLAFARSLGEFGATITVAGNIAGQTRTLPLAVHAAAQVPGGDSDAARLVLLSVAVSLAAMIGSELLARRWGRGFGSGRS